MAQNMVYEDDQHVTYKNSTGGTLLSGRCVPMGNSEVVVLKVDVLNTAEGAAFRRGVFMLPKVQAEVWAVGDKIFVDTATGVCTKTGASGKQYAGIAHKAAVNPSDFGEVFLNWHGGGGTATDITTLLATLKAGGIIAY